MGEDIAPTVTVTPFTGVWIETLLDFPNVLSPISHSLHGRLDHNKPSKPGWERGCHRAYQNAAMNDE